MHVLSMWGLQDGAGVMAGYTLAGPAHALGALVMAGAAGDMPQAGLEALASLLLDAADPQGRVAAAVILYSLAGNRNQQQAMAQAALPAIVASLQVWAVRGCSASAQQPAMSLQCMLSAPFSHAMLSLCVKARVGAQPVDSIFQIISVQLPGILLSGTAAGAQHPVLHRMFAPESLLPTADWLHYQMRLPMGFSPCWDAG